MKYGLFCSEFFTDHFSKDHLGQSDPAYAENSKNCRKISKNRPCFGLNFLETGTEIEKTLSMIFPSLFDDFKTLFGLIIFLEIRNILFRKSILID